MLDWLSITIEVVLFLALGLGYYYYQKRKIIRHAKADILYRINQLLEDNDIDAESINRLFYEGEYTSVANQLKVLKNDDEMTKLVEDLLEMNKFA